MMFSYANIATCSLAVSVISTIVDVFFFFMSDEARNLLRGLIYYNKTYKKPDRNAHKISLCYLFSDIIAKKDVWIIISITFGILLLYTNFRIPEMWKFNFHAILSVYILAINCLVVRLLYLLYFVAGGTFSYRLFQSRLYESAMWVYSSWILFFVPKILETILIFVLVYTSWTDKYKWKITEMADSESIAAIMVVALAVINNIIIITWWRLINVYDNNYDLTIKLVAGNYYNPECGFLKSESRRDKNNVFLFWLTPVLKLGYRRPLELEDLTPLPSNMASNFLVKTFLLALARKRRFEQKKQSTYTEPYVLSWLPSSDTSIYPAIIELLSVLYSVHGAHFRSAGVVKLCACLFSFSGPVLLGAIVNYVEGTGPTTKIWYGVFLVVSLGLSFVISATLNTCYSIRCSIMQCKLNGLLMRLVNHRTLSLPIHAWSDDLNISSDQITTIIQVDVPRVANMCQSIHDLWTLPLEVIFAFVLLYYQVKEAFFAGVVIIVIMIPINTIIAKRIGVSTKLGMLEKEKRVHVLSEAIFNIKGVKMLGWETAIMKIASALRNSELKYLSIKKYLDSICVFLWAIMPVFVPFATFVVTVLIGNKLTAAKVFTTVALLNTLIFPMNAFPWVVNGFVEASVSLKRVVKLASGVDRSTANIEQYNTSCKVNLNKSYVGYLIRWLGFNFLYQKIPSSDNQSQKLKVHLDFGYDLSDQFSWGTDSFENIKGNEETQKPLNSVHDKEIISTVEVRECLFLRTMKLTNADTLSSEQSQATAKNSVGFSIGPINMSVRSGELIAFIGTVASGKSGVLLGFLNEIKNVSGSLNLKSCNGVGYCSQVPHLHGGMTVRDNIVLDSDYDESRYKRVLKGCGLLYDFKTKAIDNGDMNMIKPGGTNLSGGQRLRVGIARALYSSSDIVLLDDPFSALDASTATYLRDFLVEEVVMRKRIIILTTHHVHLLGPANLIIGLDNGKEIFRGSYEQLKPSSALETFSTCARLDLSQSKGTQDVITEDKAIENEDEIKNEEGLEDQQVGAIKVSVFYQFVKAGGVVLSVITIFFTFLMQCTINGMAYWLAYWVSHMSSFTASSFIWISSLIVIANIVFTALRSVLFAFTTLRAAKRLHAILVESLFSAPLKFFEETSLGRIANRIGRDTNCIDDELPFMLNIVLAQMFLLAGSVAVIAYSDPIVLVVLVAVGVVYFRLQNFYRQSSRNFRRLDSVYRSPVYTQVLDCLADATAIRSMKKLLHFEKRFTKVLDESLRVNRIVMVSSQWLSIRLQLLGAVVATSLAFSSVICLAYNLLPQQSESLLGLSLSYSLTLVSNLNGLVGAVTETEKEMISVERVVEYIDLPSEFDEDEFDDFVDPESTLSTTQQSNRNSLYLPLLKQRQKKTVSTAVCKLSPLLLSWPSRGAITFDKLSMTYSNSKVPAIKSISLSILPGSKVAVIGRTGSGKSSLIRSILHLSDYYGSIFIDGVELRNVPKKYLRSQLSVISQDSVIFPSTLRHNVDPYNMCTDDQVIDCIRRCGLADSLIQTEFNRQSDISSGKNDVVSSVMPLNVTSDSDLSANSLSMNVLSNDYDLLQMSFVNAGKSLSQGQKQLVCLARTLLKPSKVILIDEATSSIDLQTEATVYKCLRDKAEREKSTVLCICHKLEGAQVLCDLILEMRDGEIVNYGPIASDKL